MFESTKRQGYLSVSLFALLCVLIVNRIKEQHKVSVRIPPDNEKSNLIRIEGDPQGVQLARKELLEMAARMVRKLFPCSIYYTWSGGLKISRNYIMEDFVLEP